MTGTTEAGSRSSRAVLILIAVVVVLGLLAAAAFFLTHRRAQLPPSIYGKPESTEAPATRPPPPAPPGMVTVYGAAGTFGTVADAPGHPRPVAVKDWAFDAGTSAFFSGVTANGRVLIGTVPQTDNQAVATGKTMSIGVLDPAAPGGPSFSSLHIPTSGGDTEATTINSDVGGADVSDLCAVTTKDGPRVTALSSVPYRLWDLGLGEFPAVVSLVDDDRQPGTAAVRIDKARTHEPEQLRGSGPGRAALVVGAGATDALPSAPGFTECDPLPGGDLAVTQYFPASGHRSGGLVALDPDGNVVAFRQLDDVTLTGDLTVNTDNRLVHLPSGTPVTVSPREVRADPHTTDPRDQRFVVVFDTGADTDPAAGTPAPSGTVGRGTGSSGPVTTVTPTKTGRVGLPELVQEFRYDATTHAIDPTSPLLALRDDHPATDPSTDLVFALTTAYAPDGTLFVSRTHAGSLLSSSAAVFRPGSLGTRPTTAAPLGHVVAPDTTLGAFDGVASSGPSGQNDFGAIFSLTYDAHRQLLLGVSAGNAVLRVAPWPGWDHADATTAGVAPCQADLGGRALSDANAGFRFQARQGALDPPGTTLYLAYQGLPRSSDAPHNAVVPQFLFAVNLDDLATACRG